jgi:hypothetical protein
MMGIFRTPPHRLRTCRGRRRLNHTFDTTKLHPALTPHGHSHIHDIPSLLLLLLLLLLPLLRLLLLLTLCLL